MNKSSPKKSQRFKFWSGLFCVIIIGLTGIWIFNNYNVISGKGSRIPVAMALDDGYLYPTIVAVTSIMENSDEGTEYDFYIMHSPEFKIENKEKLNSLAKKYNRCHIKLINMGDQYKNANDKGHITTPAYYRLSLSELLHRLDKIIWIDGDTLTFHDLKKFYEIDMSGYYYKGFLDDNVSAVDKFGIDNDHCICSGVMLVNLKELRKDNIVEVFQKFIKENNERLNQHDQTTINVVCYKKIGILPPEFGIYTYDNADNAAEQSKVYRYKNGYTSEELKNAYNNPTVLHCIRKPWKNIDAPYASLWWDYAAKSDFFEEIHAKYPVF